MRTKIASPYRYAAKVVFTLVAVFSLLSLPIPTNDDLSILDNAGTVPSARANSTYATLSTGNFSFTLTAGTANLITSNDNWSAVPSVEGYFGQNLTATHGVDPQTILGTEFSGNTLPNTPTNVSANKGNPNAFNAGGIAEFDSGTYLAIGLQGNVQANPYLVFYLNTLGRANVTFNYDIIDIDGGSNNSVSPVALQYRVGNSGLFTNLPDGYVADATLGPNLAGLTNSKSVALPPAAWHQPQVQVRLITTNAANSSGSSTPDEWIGVNNVTVTSLAPSSGQASLSGRVFSPTGTGLSGASVWLIDEFGTMRTVATGTAGYFKFTVSAGKTYILGVSSRRYVFDTQVVNVEDSVSGFDFYPLGAGTRSTQISATSAPEAPSVRVENRLLKRKGILE